MTKQTKFAPLSLETRAALPTACAAHHLNRRPQTLRKWASKGGVPGLIPLKLHGRLLWPTAAIRQALGVSQ